LDTKDKGNAKLRRLVRHGASEKQKQRKRKERKEDDAIPRGTL
jgi:hypothetical protein